MCNCSNKTYVVTLPNGSRKTYKTEVEAKAAIARSGGGSYTRQ